MKKDATTVDSGAASSGKSCAGATPARSKPASRAADCTSSGMETRGGPGWVYSDRFDIVAKFDPAAGDPGPNERRQMLAALLERGLEPTGVPSDKMTLYHLVGREPLRQARHIPAFNTVPGLG